MIASHYLEAYRADPDAEDAQTLRANARVALARAGDRARALAAARQARGYYQRAAELAEEPSDEAGLLEQIGITHRDDGDPADALSAFERSGTSSPSRGCTTTPPASRRGWARRPGSWADRTRAPCAWSKLSVRSAKIEQGRRMLADARRADGQDPVLPRSARRRVGSVGGGAAHRGGDVAPGRPLRSAQHEGARPQLPGPARGVAGAADAKPGARARW